MLNRTFDASHQVSSGFNLGNMIDTMASEVAAKLESTLDRRLKSPFHEPSR